MMLRTIAERLSRNLVFKRRLPTEFGGGKIFVSPDASLRYWRSNLTTVDILLLKMVDELVKPGHVVWDIGANLGLFTFAAANRAGPLGKIVALEPDPWLAGLLNRSCGLSERRMEAPITVIQKAASDRAGVAAFHIAGRGRASNHLEGGGSTQAGGSRGVESVETITLDSLLEQVASPDVVKIDVEGFEHLVLRGSDSVLNTARPVIWCEVNAANQDAVSEILNGHDYELFCANVEPGQRRPLEKAAWDTLACPSRMHVDSGSLRRFS